MPRKLVDVFTALPLLIASLFGGLIFLAAFAGHPAEWILDAYYSIFPATAVEGVMALFAFIGLLSLWLFGFALVRIFRRAPAPESTGGVSTESDARNNRWRGP